MRLSPGSHLGPYEIRELIDRGGMGEVYRARDTRLKRDVAIKVMTPARSGDASMRARFEREARVLSNLRHPHICALYDVGITDGREESPTPYLVMEYLEGQTLDRILRKGGLPVERVVRYGIEIAEALRKAHRENILHRDLKPSNVIITENGASLLDFGLAKLLSPANEHSPAPTDAITADQSLTPDGTVLGTTHYMAPEELEGKEPDARSDIFALGVCLYEMATGRRPFDGNSRAAVVAAILQYDPPPPSETRPGIPISLDWVIKTALAKDPDERFQTAHDVMLELKRIGDAPATRPQQAGRRGRIFLWTAAGLAAGIAFLALFNAVRAPQTTRRSDSGIRHFSVVLPAGLPLTSANVEKIAVSADGSRVVYVAEGDPPTLYLYSLADGAANSARALSHTENARNPFFSADGHWIGFSTPDGFLKKISVDGGEPITIAKTGDLRGAAWNERDVIVLGSRWSPLKTVSALGGAVTVLPETGNAQFDARWPVFLPGGDRVLYTSFDMSGNYDNAQLAVFDLRSRKSTPILRGATYGRFVQPRELLYFRSGTLFSAVFDPDTLRVGGEPVPRVTDADYYYASGLAHFAVSNGGVLFYIPRDEAGADGQLVWIDRRGHQTAISPIRRSFRAPQLCSDGTRALVSVDEGPTAGLWTYDLSRQAWSRLTTMIGNAIWSPDGRNVAFSSNRNGPINVYVMPVDASTPPRQITHVTQWPFATSWSPDGSEIAMVEQFKDTLTDIYVMRADGSGTPHPFLATSSNESAAIFSPDGNWIAYESDVSGRYEVYVTRYPSGGRRWLVSTDGGSDPQWRRDGKELFYRNGTRFMAVDVDPRSEIGFGKPHMLFEGEFASAYGVTRDGAAFLMVRRQKPAARDRINVLSGIDSDAGSR